MEFLQHLLPDQPMLHLEDWSLDRVSQRLTLTIAAVQLLVQCPLCQEPTRRVHSRYQRTLRDLPCINYAVILLLRARKFFCDNDQCKRRIFTERLPQVILPWARRTCRLAAQLVAVGLALGGAVGARLSHQLGYPVSLHSLLQLIARLPLPQLSAPNALGVDDFALRRGQRYGTILVDLDRQCPIALLPDREANTLADWLQIHPGVQVLSRDRSKTYKQGMTKGAPQDIQVVDRFHLLQNLAEVLERFLAGQSKVLKAVALVVANSSVGTAKLLTEREQRAQQRREERLARYEQVHRLRQQGVAVPDIAHHLGMGKRTVFRFLASPEFPEWQSSLHQIHSSGIDAYKSYLLQLWESSCRQTKQLFAQIQQQGAVSSYSNTAIARAWAWIC